VTVSQFFVSTAFGSGGEEEVLMAERVMRGEAHQKTSADQAQEIGDAKSVLQVSPQPDAQWSPAFEVINDGIALIDPEGRIIRCNAAMAALVGLPKEEVVGKYCFSVVHGLEKPVPECPIVAMHASRHRETLEILLNGRWFRVSADPIFDAAGNVAGGMHILTDITERTQEEAALRESETKYRALIETTNTGFVIVDPTGRVLDANDEYARLTGHTRRDEILGRSVLEWTAAYDQEHNRKLLEAVMREGLARNIEIDYVGPEGRIVPIEGNGTVVAAKSGTQILALCRDITERRRAGEKLRTLQQQLTDIIEFLPDATFVIDRERKVIAWNKALEELTGTKKEEILGRGDHEYALPFYGVKRPVLVDLVFEPDADIKAKYGYVEQRGTTLMAEGFLPVVREGKGAYFWAVASPLYDEKGNVVGAIESVRDITERRRAEKVLRESEERFRELAELLPETVFETDLEGKLTFMNRTAFEQFRYTLEDFAAGVNGMELLAPARREEIREEMRKVVQGEEKKFGPLELMMRRKDGSEFPAMVHANAVIHDGATRGFRGIVVDMTRQKRLEMQLLQSQKLEAIGTLAGGIAHDFNNILMAIQGRASLMALNLGERNPYYRDLQSMEELVGRGADLTRQLLGFARGGKYEVRLTDLNELIEKNSELFGRTKKEVTIHRKLREGLWAVAVDQGQMEQVFLNVYVNAGQAMRGGGDLYLETENVVIDETYVKPFKVKPGKYVKVTVTDTGVGMDEETKRRIFEPFFTTREMGRGTGLGLATVYGIVKNHGGIINVYSEKGHGTTFTIYLPASEQRIRREERKKVEVVKGTGTVLLVDDEKVIREVGSAMLEALGYRVFVAAQGEEAVRLYQTHQDKIDLVILDMIMPGISGGDTYDLLRKINPKVKVLLSSGYSVNGQAQKILDRGCDAFIQKPFDVIMLSYKIHEILG
jgi:two-component system, cell cycle sensor histidine kinase and response regulator CckA